MSTVQDGGSKGGEARGERGGGRREGGREEEEEEEGGGDVGRRKQTIRRPKESGRELSQILRLEL